NHRGRAAGGRTARHRDAGLGCAVSPVPGAGEDPLEVMARTAVHFRGALRPALDSKRGIARGLPETATRSRLCTSPAHGRALTQRAHNRTESLQFGVLPSSREGSRRFVRDRQSLQRLLQGADIDFDGPRPWDIRINDPRAFRAILTRGSLGAGESYMEGWWDCVALDEMIARVLSARVQQRLSRAAVLRIGLLALLSNPQTIRRSRKVARQHYDIGDDLYAAMLDPRMIYSCAYWQEGDTLAA